MPGSFCRTPCMHCFPYTFRNSVKFSFQFRQFQSRGHSALGTLRAASLACPKLHTCTWRDPGVGGALARLRWRVLRRPAPRNGRQGGERRRNAVRRRPNPLVAPRGLLRASARMRHRRRGAARTERALCRRRARATPFRRARPKHPNPGQFSTKTDPLNLRDDARLPNHPDRALRHRNRSPEISVHGNRLGPPIKRAPSSPSCTQHHHSSPKPRQATRGTSRRSPSPAPAAPIRLGLQLDSVR